MTSSTLDCVTRRFHWVRSASLTRHPPPHVCARWNHHPYLRFDDSPMHRCPQIATPRRLLSPLTGFDSTCFVIILTPLLCHHPNTTRVPSSRRRAPVPELMTRGALRLSYQTGARPALVPNRCTSRVIQPCLGVPSSRRRALAKARSMCACAGTLGVALFAGVLSACACTMCMPSAHAACSLAVSTFHASRGGWGALQL